MAERTAVKQRTRRALLLAGIAVLSRDPSAALSEVAGRAGVARSTLHRYFPDRRSLVAAIFELADEEYEAAIARARPDEGSGIDAFRRLCIELIERLDVLMWWLHPAVAAMVPDGGADELDEDPDSRIAAIVARGHADGSIDPSVSPEWVERLLWAAMHASAYAPTTGAMTGFEARAQCLRSLLKVVAANPATV